MTAFNRFKDRVEIYLDSQIYKVFVFINQYILRIIGRILFSCQRTFAIIFILATN